MNDLRRDRGAIQSLAEAVLRNLAVRCHKFFLTLVILGLFLLSANAADKLVEFPTGSASWTVDITYHETTSPKDKSDTYVPRRARKVEVTQADDLRRTVITWSDGKVSERWTIQGLPVIFEQDPRDANVVFPTQTGSLMNRMTEFDIPSTAAAFSWLKPDLRAKEEPVQYRDKECYHYSGNLMYPAPREGGAPAAVKAEAWIDSKTLLPVALDSEIALCVFTFQERPSTTPLDIPPVFQQRIKSYKEAMGIP